MTPRQRPHHRLGHRPARQGRHQRRPRGHASTPATRGSSSAPASASGASAAPPPASAIEAAAAGHGAGRRHAAPTSTSCCSARRTPDEAMPASASAIQQALGVRGGAVDLNAACSGFVYGLVAADGFLRAGHASACCSSAPRRCRASSTGRTAPPRSSSATAPARWCSSGATGPGGVLGWDLGSDGSLRHILHADVGGTIEMDGPEVFRRAVRDHGRLRRAGPRPTPA